MTETEIRAEIEQIDARLERVTRLWKALGSEIHGLRGRRERLERQLEEGVDVEPPTVDELRAQTDAAVVGFREVTSGN